MYKLKTGQFVVPNANKSLLFVLHFVPHCRVMGIEQEFELGKNLNFE